MAKFNSENQPKNRRSRKGVPNRATAYKRLLKIKTKVSDPADGREKIELTLYEAAALGQIQSAIDGNTRAWQEIQDTLHGKITEKVELAGDPDRPKKVVIEYVNTPVGHQP